MTTAKASSKGVPNTGPIYYLSNANSADNCSDQTEKIEDECGKNGRASKKMAQKSSLSNDKIGSVTSKVKTKLAALEKSVKSNYNYTRSDENGWIEDHCYGLWIKPMKGDDFTPFSGEIAKIKGQLEKSPKTKKNTSELSDINRMLSDDDKVKITPSTVLAEMMTAAANANPCIQARRCNLVPYKETESRTIDKKPHSSAKAQAKTGAGCCPGQTGHHVLPGAMFGKGKGNPCPEEYKHSQAPVICVEGTGNQVGSHGLAHEALDISMKVYKKTRRKTISYKDACTQGIDAIRQVNPSCSVDCIQAQLDAHYVTKLKCKNAKLKPHSGMKETPKPKPKVKAKPAANPAKKRNRV